MLGSVGTPFEMHCTNPCVAEEAAWRKCLTSRVWCESDVELCWTVNSGHCRPTQVSCGKRLESAACWVHVCCCSPSIDLVAFKPICEFRGKLVKEFRYAVNIEAPSELPQRVARSVKRNSWSKGGKPCMQGHSVNSHSSWVARSGKRNSWRKSGMLWIQWHSVNSHSSCKVIQLQRWCLSAFLGMGCKRTG